jgi:hypothetical protein
MKAMIASKELRSTGSSYLVFPINENEFDSSSDRIVSRTEVLDGTVVVQDWGFAEGRKVITATVLVSLEQYELLVDFQEDNANEFLFHYKTDSYVVIVRSVLRQGFQGLKVRAGLRLDVVQKLLGDGEYAA